MLYANAIATLMDSLGYILYTPECISLSIKLCMCSDNVGLKAATNCQNMSPAWEKLGRE
jgi:hypothetical protein